MKRVRCNNCNQMVSYKIKKSYKNICTEDNKEIGRYEHLEAYCSQCDNFIYIDEIQKQNITNKNNEMRKIAGIITFEDIKKIPRRYAIPRLYLNIVMEIKTPIWEEEIPTTRESNRLKKVLHDKEEYLKYLQRKKGKIPEFIYERSLLKTNKLKK